MAVGGWRTSRELGGSSRTHTPPEAIPRMPYPLPWLSLTSTLDPGPLKLSAQG